mmetsp:Transcript_20081/g.54090  ORF Transcript_20081/g.54090 Transcript_20081/m.54090 type:complete len:224 (+) Transcript_20081:641-1312(+)
MGSPRHSSGPKLESSSSLARRGTYGGSIACISSVCQSKSASHADARTSIAAEGPAPSRTAESGGSPDGIGKLCRSRPATVSLTSADGGCSPSPREWPPPPSGAMIFGSVSGHAYVPRRIASKRRASSPPAPSKGSAPQSISKTSTPKPHQSTALVAPSPRSTSGARYCGVPTRVHARSAFLAKPRSHSLRLPPELSSRFSGFMSRKMKPLLCKCSSASVTDAA